MIRRIIGMIEGIMAVIQGIIRVIRSIISVILWIIGMIERIIWRVLRTGFRQPVILERQLIVQEQADSRYGSVPSAWVRQSRFIEVPK